MKKLLLTATALSALAGTANADTVWSFSNPNGDQGVSHPYVGNDLVSVITATAFGPALDGNPAHLYGKNGGVGETGLGLTNDPTGDNEISSGSFIQFDLTKLNLSSLNLSFEAGSTTGGESWSVIGTNTAGSDIGSLLGSCNSGTSSGCEGVFTLNGAGNFNYIDVTTGLTPAESNVLVKELDAQVDPVPGPIAGAGLPGLVGGCLAMLGLGKYRRRRNGTVA
jgi:hypothetical protein